MKIFTIKTIIDIKISLHVTLKQLFVKKKIIYMKSLYIWVGPNRADRKMCRDKIRQIIIGADTGLKSQPFWVGPNG